MQFAVSAGIVLAIILSVVGAALWLRRDGRRAERADAAEASNEVKNRQLETAANAPKGKGELVDRIRKEGW